MAAKKVIFVVADGMADRPIPKLDRRTPLEAAKTPNLDQLAKDGISGAMNTVDVGVRPGSDTAHLALFGYDPNVYYTGRGPFEAAAVGFDLKEGDIAWRGNMGTVDENLVITDRRAGRISDTTPFADEMNGTVIDGIEFILSPGSGYRIPLIMRGKGLSDQVSDVDTHVANVKVHEPEPLDSSEEAEFTAKVLKKFLQRSHEVFKGMEINTKRAKEGKPQANYLLIRGAGFRPELPNFKDKYNLDAACIAGAGMYKGIARLLGMDVFDIPGATGKPDSNLLAKVDKLKESYNDYDFFFFHVKGADPLSHDEDYEGKVKFLEKFDEVVGELRQFKEAVIVVTADHSTPCTLGEHSADDVPVTIYSPEVRDDDVEHFNERECAKGRLGHIRGMNLMPIVIDLMGLASMFGA
ncbi:2,3-bisphosphoglycerate-independent phosphoglycerate mutase [Candidatus Dojkabacteria bacterium]|nr:2,3-bisphosphoglycerate-independent phosphoglycerate mutase [Candidatus Dojkabacteria bacterium]